MYGIDFYVMTFLTIVNTLWSRPVWKRPPHKTKVQPVTTEPPPPTSNPTDTIKEVYYVVTSNGVVNSYGKYYLNRHRT